MAGRSPTNDGQQMMDCLHGDIYVSLLINCPVMIIGL